MDDITINPTATVALLVATNLFLLACLVSNGAAAAVLTVVRRSLAWVPLKPDTALAVAARVVRQP